MVDARDCFLMAAGLYLFRYFRKVYKRNRRLTKASSKLAYILVLAFVHFNAMMSLDVALDFFLGWNSDPTSSLKSYQYKILVPFTHYLAFEVLYALVIFVFFLVSYFVLNEIVYQSMDDYLHSYHSGVEQIIRMCANLITQSLLLIIVYFTLLLLACWYFRDQAKPIWKDDGFLLLVGSVLGGAMRYPQRRGGDWKDFYYNSVALFISLKVMIFCFA